MSLRYKLFGIPRTFDEFVDKVKRKEQKEVTVVLGSYCHSAISYADDRQYTVRHYVTELESANIKMKLRDVPVSLAVTRNHTETEQEMKELSEDTANKLNKLGLETKMITQF